MSERRYDQEADPRIREAGHEPQTVRARWVVLFAAGLLCMLAVVLLGVGGLIQWFGRGEPPAAGPPAGLSEAPPSREPPPRTFERIGDVRRRLDREQRASLKKLEWIDRQRGVARIPVERAMELIAENGPAYYEKATSAGSLDGSQKPGGAPASGSQGKRKANSASGGER